MYQYVKKIEFRYKRTDDLHALKMDSLPPEIIAHIASYLSSPLDCYSFYKISKKIKDHIYSYSYGKGRLSLIQGIAIENLHALSMENRLVHLIGLPGIGKTYMIIYYILQYWRKTGKSIIATIPYYRFYDWIRMAKSILGNKIPISIGKVMDKPGISIILTDKCPYTYGLHSEDHYSGIRRIPSSYGLIVVDEEGINMDIIPEIKHIFVHRPKDVVEQCSHVNLKHNIQIGPKAEHHILYSDNMEETLQDLFTIYDRIVLMRVRDEEKLPHVNNVCIYKGINAVKEFNQHKEGKVLFYDCRTTIGNDLLTDCVIYYCPTNYIHRIKAAEIEKRLLQYFDSPYSKISFYHILHLDWYVEKDTLRLNIAASIISRSLGNLVENIIMERVSVGLAILGPKIRYETARTYGIDLKKVNDMDFFLYYYPELYSFIKSLFPHIPKEFIKDYKETLSHNIKKWNKANK